MNKVYQLNILQVDDGFIVQASGKQYIATNEATLQEKVKQVVTLLLSTPEQTKTKTQTIKHFGQPEAKPK